MFAKYSIGVGKWPSLILGKLSIIKIS